MLIIGPEALRQALDWPSAIAAIAAMFRDGCEAPVRHHHKVEVPGAPAATLLLMPAWSRGQYIGVKVANVFPGNAAIGLPAVSASFMLFSGQTGELLALLDGGELTARRTVATSALAVSYLARPNAARLLIVGTGRLARLLAFSHSAVRPLRRVMVWGRDAAKAAALAREIEAQGLPAMAARDLAAAVAEADIVSCATLSEAPIVRGEWLRPGTHLDLIGGFTPAMREADDEAVKRSSVFVDTYDGATTEAGDIVSPLRSGVLARSGIQADLHDLARGRHPGRTRPDEITFFKSVGAALEDLAAAGLAYARQLPDHEATCAPS